MKEFERLHIQEHGRGGFSIVELMTVVVIIGIMAGVALGSDRQFTQGNALEEGTTMVKTMLIAGRQSAITHGTERRVALDLGNDVLWLEAKIHDGVGNPWINNSKRIGEVLQLPRFVDLADVYSALGLAHPSNIQVFPTGVAPVFYVAFNSAGNVTEIDAGKQANTTQTSFSIHLTLTSDPLPVGSRKQPYDWALISSGKLASYKGKVGPGADEQDAQAMLVRRGVATITVLGNTGRIKVYPYGRNFPWSDSPPAGALR